MGFRCGPYQELTSGGNVSFTSGCKIHTFTSSGTFINSSSNSYYADILVVGGGGGSGYDGPTPIVIGNKGGTAGGGAGGSVLKRKWVTISNNTSFPTIIGSAGNSSPNVNIEGGGPGTGGGDTIFNSPGNNGVSELKAPGGAKGAESRDWVQGPDSVNIDNPLGSGGGGSASWGDGIYPLVLVLEQMLLGMVFPVEIMVDIRLLMVVLEGEEVQDLAELMEVLVLIVLVDWGVMDFLFQTLPIIL